MNVIPGYHAAVALVMWATGRTGLFSARLVSTLISALAVLVFYLLAWTVERRSALVRTLQFAFFPIFFPFFSLVYMDILALLLALLGFLLVLRRHYSLAGLAGIAERAGAHQQHQLDGFPVRLFAVSGIWL